MKKQQKTPEQLQEEKRKLGVAMAQIKMWIDSGIPSDFQDWDFIKAGNYRKAMETANKLVGSAQPKLQTVLEVQQSLA